MKKFENKSYETLREELVKQANDADYINEHSLKSIYSRKRKSTINKIRYKISNLSLESGDI